MVLCVRKKPFVLSYVVNKLTRNNVPLTYIACHFDYCAPSMDRNIEGFLRPLRKLQQWALRIIYHNKVKPTIFRYSTTLVFYNTSFDGTIFSIAGVGDLFTLHPSLSLQRMSRPTIFGQSDKKYFCRFDSSNSSKVSEITKIQSLYSNKETYPEKYHQPSVGDPCGDLKLCS